MVMFLLEIVVRYFKLIMRIFVMLLQLDLTSNIR